MVLTERINHQRIIVKDASYVGQARREVCDLASERSFDEEALGRLSIIVTEMATNLAKHVDGGGEILVSFSKESERDVINVISIDHGAGMKDLDALMKDGASTKGTLGGGLGAINRKADAFECLSDSCCGTILLARVVAHSSTANGRHDLRHAFELGALSVPHPRERVCGDGVGTAENGLQLSILVLDGLGHGEGAARASQMALDEFFKNPFDEPKATTARIHESLVSSRGAALMLCRLDRKKGLLDYVGVGNISARVFTGVQTRGCGSSRGAVGLDLGSLRAAQLEWENRSSLLIFTDGIKSAATLRGFEDRSALMSAAAIYRDYARNTDDSTVLVVKNDRSGLSSWAN